MKIEIAKPFDNGSCSSVCPLYHVKDVLGCAVFDKRPPVLGYFPGPDCKPGVYVLVPEAEEKALRELAEAAEKYAKSCNQASPEGAACWIHEANFIKALSALRALKGGGK
jgi:hypothetical protein